MKRPLIVAYTFVLMNWAAVLGLYHFLCGHADIWHRYSTRGNARGESPAGA